MRITITTGGVHPGADELIRNLDSEVERYGWRAEFHHTGGGCTAIRVRPVSEPTCTECGSVMHHMLITTNDACVPLAYGDTSLMVAMYQHHAHTPTGCWDGDGDYIVDDEFATADGVRAAAVHAVSNRLHDTREGRR